MNILTKNTLGLEHTGERWVPGVSKDNDTKIQHIARYVWAAQWAKDRKVLDCSCGAGYGSMILSLKAKSVIGVDIDPEIIEFAETNFGHIANVAFHCADACYTDLNDDEFGLVVGFETIEHIEDYEAYLLEMKRVMRPEGLFIISTPDRAIRKNGPIGGFHKQEWFFSEFAAICEGHFSSVNWFWQQWDGKINPAPSPSHDTFIVGFMTCA